MIITLTGPNEFLIRQTVDAFTAAFAQKYGTHGIERVNGEAIDLGVLADLSQGTSLFAQQRLILLDGAAKNKPIWDALGEWLEKIPAETTLVVVEPALDKRTKTYKQLVKQSDFRTFDDLSERQLATWLKKQAKQLGASLDDASARYLVQRVGVDQWQLWQEVQKLANYRDVIDKSAIDDMVEANPQASAFELLDSVLGRKPQAVERLLASLTTTEDPYKLFGLLVSQIHALAIVTSAGTRGADQIAKDAGIHPFVVRKTMSLARQTSATALASIIASVAHCDTQLKSTGADPWLLLGQCLHKIANRS
jgi:DNA polymerase-3 subunit delta